MGRRLPGGRRQRRDSRPVSRVRKPSASGHVVVDSGGDYQGEEHGDEDTAEHGDYTGGPKIVTAQTRQVMRRMLDDIRDGSYARAWIAENAAGRPSFAAQRARERAHPIEQVGAALRPMMPFVNPAEVPPERDRGGPDPGVRERETVTGG